MRNVQWIEGKPKQFEVGMLLKDDDGDIHVAGHGTDSYQENYWSNHIIAWAWLIQPYQLEWLEDMAKRHKVKAR